VKTTIMTINDKKRPFLVKIRTLWIQKYYKHFKISDKPIVPAVVWDPGHAVGTFCRNMES